MFIVFIMCCTNTHSYLQTQRFLYTASVFNAPLMMTLSGFCHSILCENME